MDKPSINPPSAFNWNRAKITHRGHFPHVRQDNALYFVTFRLGDSLSVERRNELLEQRKTWLKQNPPPHNPDQQDEFRRIWTVRIENLLDAGQGSCVLRHARCREFLEQTMRHDDGVNYALGDFVIMPNHVHLLICMPPEEDLSQVIKTWKTISSRKINQQIGRHGTLWRREYFDHAVRSDQDANRFIQYIRKNPEKLNPNDYTLGKGTLIL